ncbi:hypothetical protein HDE_00196 [Halotydeus destructor]|nr:hypothetical protein HDE_00196 [Halotydeus destructor]
MFMTCLFLCFIYGEVAMYIVSQISHAVLDVGQLEQDQNDLNIVTGELSDKLSIITMIRFACTFAESLAYFVDFNNGTPEMIGSEAYTIYSLTFNFICLLSAVIINDNINRNVKTEFRKQYAIILQSDDLSQRAEYIYTSMSDFKLNLTAFGGLVLNKEFMFSYLSSLVTFTILFMQLNKVV